MNKLLIIAILILIMSCKKDNGCLQSVGRQTSETRLLPEFHQIFIESDIDVKLVQDSVNFAVIYSGDNIIPHIQTQVDNRVLSVSFQEKCNFLRRYDYKKEVEIHFKRLKNIDIDGNTGKIYSTDTLYFDTLYMNIRNAASEIDLSLKTAKIKCDYHNGVGDMVLKGYSELSYFYHHGYGKYDAQNLYSDQIYAWNNNIGDLYLYTNNLLEIQISYTGNVYYKGKPNIIRLKREYSGQLIPLD